MLRIVANLNHLFQDLPLKDRFAAAKDAGFEHVALQSPYEMSISELDRLLSKNHLQLAMICTSLGDWDAGERGFMGVPRQIADFRKGFETALDYARALDVEIIHLMAGIAPLPRAHKMLTRNLAWAAFQAPDRTLALGPMDPRDAPGYAIESFDHAVELMDWIGAPNLGLHVDAYCAAQKHMGIADALSRYGDRACHIDLVGNSGPMEDETRMLSTLREAGFAGTVSVSRMPQDLHQND